MATALITRQEPDQYDFTNPANPVLGVKVFFQTGLGNIGSIFVPYNRYTVKNVHTLVAGAATLIDQVSQLQVNY